MRYYTFFEQWHVDEAIACVTISEKGILDFYWERWCDLMYRAGKGALISTELCIEDFVTVNWAFESDGRGKQLVK